jgi:hypothetical protein
VAWGATIADAAKALGGMSFQPRFCETVPTAAETWCLASFDLGNVGSHSDFRFGDDHLVGVDIHFSASAFEYVRGVFEEKYGPPSTVRSENAQVLAGAQLQNEVLLWNFKDVSIELRHYGTKVTEGSATFDTRAWIAERARRLAAERKRASDSF